MWQSMSKLSLKTSKVLFLFLFFFSQTPLYAVWIVFSPASTSLWTNYLNLYCNKQIPYSCFKSTAEDIVFPSASVILSEPCESDSWHAFGEALYKMYSVLNKMLKVTVMWQASRKPSDGLADCNRKCLKEEGELGKENTRKWNRLKMGVTQVLLTGVILSWMKPKLCFLLLLSFHVLFIHPAFASRAGGMDSFNTTCLDEPPVLPLQSVEINTFRMWFHWPVLMFTLIWHDLYQNAHFSPSVKRWNIHCWSWVETWGSKKLPNEEDDYVKNLTPESLWKYLIRSVRNFWDKNWEHGNTVKGYRKPWKRPLKLKILRWPKASQNRMRKSLKTNLPTNLSFSCLQQPALGHADMRDSGFKMSTRKGDQLFRLTTAFSLFPLFLLSANQCWFLLRSF